MTAVASPYAQKSTIVRFFSAPPPIRAAFWFLERAAPDLGARWAERIWFTLPRSSAVRPAPSGGTPFTLDRHGLRLVGETWGDGPTVYLMHGWAGHGGQLAAFAAPLVARGHRVVTFDAPSHGHSAPGRFGPRSSSIPEFAAALTTVIDEYGPAHAIIAHSMGCTATTIALCDGLPVGRVALMAPLATPMSLADQFVDVLGFGDRIHKRLITRVERRVGAPMRHFDVPAIARAVAMPPALVVHDHDDRSTSVGDGQAVAGAWAGSRLHLTSGLGHRRILRDPAVITEVVTFVADRRIT